MDDGCCGGPSSALIAESGRSQDLLLGVRCVQGDLIDAVDQRVTVVITGGVLLAPVGGLDAGGHVLVVRVSGLLVHQVGQLLGGEGGQQVFRYTSSLMVSSVVRVICLKSQNY